MDLFSSFERILAVLSHIISAVLLLRKLIAIVSLRKVYGRGDGLLRGTMLSFERKMSKLRSRLPLLKGKELFQRHRNIRKETEE